MSRHRRGNSDLAGFKKITSLKRQTHCSKQSVGRLNRTFSEMESPKIQSKNRTTDCPQTPTKKYETHQFVENTYKLNRHFYNDDQTGYFEKTKNYLKSGWQQQRRSFINHLNTFPYLEQGMQKKSYSEIEESLISEWKKNPVLYNLRSLWYQTILKQNFKNIGEFIKEYLKFRDFLGQVAYLYFKGFFLTLEKKGIDDIIDRLTERTMHFIITNSSTWAKVYQKVVKELLKKKILLNDDMMKVEMCDYPLEQLEITKNAVDVQSSKFQLPHTAVAINKFINESKFYQKIQLLTDIREKLQKQIKLQQEKLISNKIIKEYKILDKDDFISTLIYCMVRGEINLQSLGASLKYFSYLIGAQYGQLLSKFGCASYCADLEAVFDHLWNWKRLESQKIDSHKSLADIEIINYSKPQNKTSFC